MARKKISKDELEQAMTTAGLTDHQRAAMRAATGFGETEVASKSRSAGFGSSTPDNSDVSSM